MTDPPRKPSYEELEKENERLRAELERLKALVEELRRAQHRRDRFLIPSPRSPEQFCCGWGLAGAAAGPSSVTGSTPSPALRLW